MLSAQVPASAETPRPNIVLILADDLGYGQLGCYGHPERFTPHLDRMAREGMRFTDFHTSGAVCSPTRAGLLTGRYHQRAGIHRAFLGRFERDRHHGLDPRETTFAELLRDAGYRTGLIGKWHLGFRPEFHPLGHGFDRFHGYLSWAVCYQSHYDGVTDYYDWWEGRDPIEEPGYSTHLITENAIKFIERVGDGPFCLYVAQEAPHWPWQGPEDPPVRGPNAERMLNWGRQEDRPEVLRAYREMVVEMDRSVGRILDALRERGLDRRTCVFFLSDNGGQEQGTNGPLRGFKADLWEGGHRVPAIAWWPGRIRPGTVNTDLTISLDLFPTMLELAGVKPPTELAIDGRSLAPVLFDESTLGPRQLFWSRPVGREMDARQENYAMRDGPWKLVVTTDDDGEEVGLYNLAYDIGEQHDLASAYAQRVKTMREAIRRWRAEVAAGATPVPEPPQSEWGPEFLSVSSRADTN